VHLTQTALETLFGAGAELGQKRALSQPGEFLSDKRVKITTPDGEIHGAAVLGPVRSAVQVELSQSDCRKLKLDAPVRLSGDLSGAADVTLQGTAGKYTAHGAAIIAKNHMHCTPAEAARLGIADGQSVNVRVNTARPVIFEDVPVRVRETFSLAMHLDTDEANACALAAGNVGTLIDCGTAPAQCAANPDAAIPSPAANEPKPIICEKLISENRAKELIKSGGTVIFAAGTILTPSAKDIFLHAHVRVEFV
jgi:propanediol utilization protein